MKRTLKQVEAKTLRLSHATGAHFMFIYSENTTLKFYSFPVPVQVILLRFNMVIKYKCTYEYFQ